MSQEINLSFCCPITHNIMIDPYIDNEGNSYEYEAIIRWLQSNNTSPITRNYLDISHLKPNRALKDIINSSNLNTRQVNDINVNASDYKIENELLSISHSKYYKDNITYVNLNITPIEGEKTAPIDIVAIIDISGSMSSPAYVQQDGKNVDVGYSILDITKHSLRMILKSLKPCDRLSLIAFSTDSEVLCNLIYITDDNIRYIDKLINDLFTKGATNIWAGLNEGLKQFEKFSLPNRINTIMFLTDGVPSEHLLPNRGIINTLERRIANLKKENKIVPNIYTYGFGYNLDTELLVDIAKIGRGNFSFIPDSGFVGTVFINSLAYIKLTICNCASIDYNNIDIKTIHYGHTLSYLFEFEENDINNVTLTLNYTTINNENYYINYNLDISNCCSLIPENEFNEILCREKLIKELDTDNLNTLKINISNYGKNYNNYNNEIVNDFKEQISMAITNDYYNKWGKNYIYSFKETHKDKRCNNFKDKSIKKYGGVLFNKIVDDLNDIYDNLPAPVPSNIVSNIDSIINSGRSSPIYNQINFSQSFNSQDNACFHKNTEILMKDYTTKKINNIVKGDELLDMNNNVSKVICVIKMKCKNNKCYFTKINNLLITPYHPVVNTKYPSTIGKTNCEWEFPYIIGETDVINTDYIYNLVLDNNHNIICDNTVCVTLGHNFNNNHVISHDYFGSNKVINDLEKMEGYEDGLVLLTGNYIQRDNLSGRVIKFVYN